VRIKHALAAAVLAAALPGLAVAQLIPQGSEFQLNRYIDGSQFGPSIAVESAGDSVVVWSSAGQDGSGYGVFGRRFNSVGAFLGAEFQINNFTNSDQVLPSVAMDGSGSFVVAWTSIGQDRSGGGVFARRFGSTGTPKGREFRVNTFTMNYQTNPSVAVDGSGNFVVVWSSDGQDGSFYGVFARRFDRAGARLGGEFQVNTHTTYPQDHPVVAMDGSGNFVVAWQSLGQDGAGYGVFAQRFDSAGVPVGGEFQVNTHTSDQQYDPSIAVGSSGNFVVAWTSRAQEAFDLGVFAQLFDSAGAPVGGEFQVNTYTTGDQHHPSVALLASGDFVVTWDCLGQDRINSIGIFAQRFDSVGGRVGGEFQVNTYTTNDQFGPSIAVDGSGKFVVAWTSDGQDYSGEGVFGQRYCANGDLDGDGICDSHDVIVTSPLGGDSVDCSNPSVAQPSLLWEAGTYDKFRVFIASDPSFGPGTMVTSGDKLLTSTSYTVSPKKWTSACEKAISANPSAPVLYMKILGVDADVSKSDPIRKTFSQVVEVSVQ